MSQKNIRKLNVPNYDQWKNDLKKFIKSDIIIRILPGNDPTIEKYRKIMTSDKAMSVWALAFTHPSYDSLTDHNLEILEYKGDKMLDYTLAVYMKKKYPSANQDTLTNFKTSFASRDPLAEISIKTKLIDHVLTVKKLTDSKEISDVFESLVGAIAQIGDELVSPGLGYMFAYNYITSIYNWYDDLRIETGETSLVNRVMQGYYDALGWKKFKDSNRNFENWNKETKTLTLYLNEKAITMLTEMGIPPKNIVPYRGKKRAILAQGMGSNEKEARDKTYNTALKNLQTIYNITPKEAKVINIKVYLNEMLAKNIINKDELESIYKGVVDMNTRHGVDWNKQTTIDTKNGKMYILNGYQIEQNQTLQLYRIIFDSKIEEESSKIARLRLYQLYAENGKIENFDYYYYS